MDGNPQKEEGYTPISHELLEAVIPMLPAQWAVFFAVMRMAYGYSQKSAEIPTKKLMELTGIKHRSHICRAIKQAALIGLIVVTNSGNRTDSTYSINKRYRSWKPVTKNGNATKIGNKTLPDLVISELPTIRVKKEKKVRPVFTPPKGEDLKANGHPWLDAEAWDKFMQFRKEKGSKGRLTALAVEQLLADCEKVKPHHGDMIRASIGSNWTGLFPDKYLSQRPGQQEPRKRKLLAPPTTQGEPT